MNNAAERLLNLQPQRIEDMAKEIIFGQLRLTVASLTIEQINQDRESFLEAIRKNVEPELNKIGLYLINVNITDITDESDYIESIGKKAASEAINRAKVDVAEQDKMGAIGQAVANRDKEIKVAENTAEAEKGKKRADADRRVFVQQQETCGLGRRSGGQPGEGDPDRRERGPVRKGKEEGRGRPARVRAGDRKRRRSRARTRPRPTSRRPTPSWPCGRPRRSRRARWPAARPRSRSRRRSTGRAGAPERRGSGAAGDRQEEDRDRGRGRGREDPPRGAGVADGILLKYEAEAKGIRQVLESKAAGYQNLVKSCNGDAARGRDAAHDREDRADRGHAGRGHQEHQDRQGHGLGFGGGHGDGGSSTSNFLSSLVRSIPPLQDVAKMAGVELPELPGGDDGEERRRVRRQGELTDCGGRCCTRCVHHSYAMQQPPSIFPGRISAAQGIE